MTDVVMLLGDPEYCSHRSMPAIAADWSTRLGVQVHLRTSSIIHDEPDFPVSTFGDLTVLDDADLVVVYTRFRRIPDSEVAALAAYLARKRPIMGLRTANHAFRLSHSSPWHEWGNNFGREIFGSPWVNHHGHSSSTDVSPAPGAPPALVAGLPGSIHVRSWLYLTDVATWCQPVLDGVPVDPEGEPAPGPVAWCGDNNGRRTYYTSIGHPDDLATPAVRDSLVNAARWALHR
jgi:type 1 glutamine amidotransferase